MDLALFDFDHTLTTHDTYSRFLRQVVPAERQRRWAALIGPLLLGYKARLVSGRMLRGTVVRLGLGGLDAAAVEAAAQTYAREVLPTLERPSLMRALAHHRDRGDAVWVVSAGLDLYLRPWCAAHGVGLLCSALEVRDGRLTGRYAGTQCGGDEKVRRVREVEDLARYARIHAWGDSREDLPMLALAHAAWWRGRLRGS